MLQNVEHWRKAVSETEERLVMEEMPIPGIETGRKITNIQGSLLFHAFG